MTLVAVLCALGAMVLFGAASVLQGMATGRSGEHASLSPRLIAELAHQRTFFAALALNLIGFCLHLVALQRLPLFLVQAVIAGAVAVTAVLSVRVLGTRLGRSGRLGVGMVVLGLALLSPTASAGDASASDGVFVGLAVAVALLLAAAVLVRRVPEPTGPVLLGLLAGAGFGVVAVCGRLLPPLGLELLSSPAAYVLVLAGGSAYAVYAAAMQRGSVTTATAAMVLTQTLVPALAGLWLGDRVRPGLLPLALTGFALALAGALLLGRGEDTEDEALAPRSPAAA